jgi:methyl-accepting chemotaxis protein
VLNNKTSLNDSTNNRRGNLWKLVAIIGVLVLTQILMAIVLAVSSKNMIGHLTELKTNDLQFNMYAQKANQGFLTVDDQTNMWVGLGVGSERFGDQTLADETLNTTREGEKELQNSLKQLMTMKLSSNERKHLGQAIEDTKSYLDFYHQVLQLNEQDHKKAQEIVYVSNSDASDALTKDLQTILDDAKKRMDNQSSQTLDITQLVYLLAWVGGILLTLLSLFCLFYTWRTTTPIVKTAENINDHLNHISNGNLSRTEIESNHLKGEMKHLVTSVNGMSRDLHSIIVKVKEASHQIAVSSEELTASAEQTTRVTEQISHAIQEVAIGSEKQVTQALEAKKAVIEITKGMSEGATSIQSIADFAASTNQKATSGNEIVNEAVKQMNIVQHQVDSTAQVVNRLGEKSKEIGQIVEMITHIANQTNLLALNASIEAARAGEHGRGFAVVADEVRILAEQSANAAGEISGLIGQIQLEANNAVEAMDEGTASVAKGIQMVHKSSDNFSEIVKMIEKASIQSQEVSTIIEEVNASSQNMVKILENVTYISEHSSGNTQNVAASAEEQNASMEEISSSAEWLSKMALELQEIVNRFKV